MGCRWSRGVRSSGFYRDATVLGVSPRRANEDRLRFAAVSNVAPRRCTI